MDDYRNELAQYYYNKDYNELSDSQRRSIDIQLQIPREEVHPAHPDNE